MSDIPSDLYRQILRRVPADSLFCFRSVCKEWRRIIDDPLFSKMHLHRPPTGSGHLFIRNTTGKLYSLPLTSLNHVPTNIKAANIKNVAADARRINHLPVASCNGLILIAASKKSMVWLLWNPFTGESLELPLRDDFVNLECGGMPRGLGYDAINDDYKVVRIAPGPNKRDVKLVTFIYSMNSNDWHRIDDFNRFFIRDFNGTGVFKNGSLYWIAQEMWLENVNCLIALDLTTETFRKVPLPSVLAYSRDKKCSLELQALGDSLFLSFSYKTDLIMDCFELWMEQDYGYDWIRILSLRPNDWSSRREGNIRPVAYLMEKEHVLVQVFSEKFLWCDVNTKCVRNVKIEGLPRKFSSQVFPASLVRLKGNNSGDHEGVDSELGTLKRKRNRLDDDRLELKIRFSHSLSCI